MIEFKTYGIARRRIGTDGHGVTDLVALAGCPLRCAYCLNRELLANGNPRSVSPEELLEDLMNEACYFVATGGGATFGGGEPTLQREALERFFEIKPDWMRVSIETSLQTDEETIRSLIPRVDEWIVDVKSLSEDVYETYARGGDGSYAVMRRNLAALAESVPEKCLVRVPTIPAYKGAKAAEIEADLLRKEGFERIDLFEYVVRGKKTERKEKSERILKGLY